MHGRFLKTRQFRRISVESKFRLTKFVSNHQDIQNQLPETEILNKKAIAEQSDQQSTQSFRYFMECKN